MCRILALCIGAGSLVSGLDSCILFWLGWLLVTGVFYIIFRGRGNFHFVMNGFIIYHLNLFVNGTLVWSYFRHTSWNTYYKFDKKDPRMPWFPFMSKPSREYSNPKDVIICSSVDVVWVSSHRRWWWWW